jgi:aminomuconate-semialdehyde/2-hydroxymuconate-6-semialdehyde dehydrogenase
VIRIQNLVDGRLKEPASDRWLDVFNPATGEAYARVPDSDEEEIAAAVAAAEAAFPDWSRTAVEERSRVLMRIADTIDDQREELALVETNDNGKPLKTSQTLDIPRASRNLRFFASMIQSFASESHAAVGTINYTLRQPLGVVACISPWNLPLYLFTWKVAPALAAGNCVVGKPSELTPMSAYRLAQICIAGGLPPGVLNIVHGPGSTTGNALIGHPAIRAVSFTGGTTTGAHIAREVAPRFKKLSLELGGKNPNIVFADCDFDEMLATTIDAAFANQGQICLSGSRILVERSCYAEFRDAFVRRTRELVVGDPLDPATNLGAVVSREHRDKIEGYIGLAESEGGTILCGGKPAQPAGRCAQGWFFEPTVIEGLPVECRTNQEEIFGPVVSLIPFDDEQQAVRMANGTRYGLSATIWTNDLGRAHRVAERLESGVVWVNCWLVRDLRTPFGGMKESGVGREGGVEALRFFTEPKNVCVKY